MMSGTAAAGGQADLRASGGRTAPGEDRFDVWAPEAHPSRCWRMAGGCPWLGIGNGWWRPESAPAAAEVDYGYLLDGQEPALPDPRSRRQPDGVHELSRTFDPGSVRLGRRWVEGPAAGRRGGLRAASGHLHPGGDTGRGDRQAASTWSSWAWTSSSCCPSTRSTARTTGVTTACSGTPCRRSTAARRPTSASWTPRTGRAGRDPGRGLQPPGAQRELPAAIRAVPIPRRRATPGGTRLNLDGPGSDQVRRVHPGQRHDVVRGTTTWTDCGSTPCTRSGTTRAVHILEELRRSAPTPWRPSWAGR